MMTQHVTFQIRRLIIISSVALLFTVRLAYGQMNLQVPVPQRVAGLSWSHDGAKLAIGFDDGTVKIIDPVNRITLSSLQLAQAGFNTIIEVSWHPVNNDLLAVSGGDFGNLRGKLSVFDTVSQQEIFSFTEAQTTPSIAWSPDGQLLAFSTDFIADNLRGRHVEIWDVISGRQTLLIRMGLVTVTSLTWSPDGKYLAGGTTDAKAIIWDASTGEVVRILSGHTAVINDIAWSPDGRFLVTTSVITDNTVRLWNASTGENVALLSDLYVNRLAWSPDGAQLAMLNVAESVEIVDHFFRARLGSFAEGVLASNVAYSPYGGRLVHDALLGPGNVAATVITDQIQIVVPAPSLDRLNAIAALCVRDGNTGLSGVQGLAQPAASTTDLPAYIARVEALPADAIPSACRADLLAVAGALLAGE